MPRWSRRRERARQQLLDRIKRHATSIVALIDEDDNSGVHDTIDLIELDVEQMQYAIEALDRLERDS